VDKQKKFRFKPNKFFDPTGSVVSLHRLWKVRCLGCLKYGEEGVAIAVQKFFCREKLGMALKP